MLLPLPWGGSANSEPSEELGSSDIGEELSSFG